MSRVLKLNLTTKFSITLIGLLISPIIIVSLLVTAYIKMNEFDRICQSRISLLEQVNQNIQYFIDDMEYVSVDILSHHTTQTLLKGYNNPESKPYEREKLVSEFSVKPLIDSRGFIKAISLYNEEGIIYQYGLRVAKEDVQFDSQIESLLGMPYWTAAYKQTYPSPYYHEYLNGEYVISLLRIINDMHVFQKKLAIERITVDEAYICSLYDAINTTGGEMFIVNQSGDIISATDKSLLGTNISERDYFSKIITGRGFFEEPNHMVFHSKLSINGWCLVMEEPMSTFMREQRYIEVLTIFNIILTLLFGLVFLIVQHYGIIRPVVRMSKEVQDFKEGNFTIRTQTNSNDEIGKLSHSLMEMSLYINNLVEREYKNKLIQREMELEYLQSQINPHFLYNTLDTIRFMALINKQKDVAEQIEALSNLFRHSLNSGEKYTTLNEEVKNLKNFILIQQARFKDSLHFDIHVDERLLDCKVIKLVIQPLVENAVVHGLEPKCSGGHISIIIDKWNEKLRCRVIDDGVGINEEVIYKYIHKECDAGRSFALKNIHDRLLLEYGDGYGLSFKGEKGSGTVVQVLQPIIYDIDEEGDHS